MPKLIGRLLFESDKTGKVWGVQLWRIGFTENFDKEGNRIYISREETEKILPQITGLGSYALEFEPGQFKHIPMYIDPAVVAKGFPTKQVGFFIDPSIGKNPDGSEGAWAFWHVTDEKLANHLHTAWEHGAFNLIGFSPDLQFENNVTEIDGVKANAIRITKLNTGDVVSDPAADGKLLREIFENNNTNWGETKMFEKIKEALFKFFSGREQGFDKLQVIMLTAENERLSKIVELLEKEANEIMVSKPNLSAQLIQLADAIKQGNEVAVLDGFQKVLVPEQKATPKPEISPTAFTPQADIKLAEKVAELEKKTIEAETKATIAEANAVVEKSNLPEPAKDAVKEAVAREVMSKRGADATLIARTELEKKRKELAALGLGGGQVNLPANSRITFGMGAGEEAVLALRGFFMGEPQKDASGRKVKPLHSLNQAARIFCGLNTYEEAGDLQEFMAHTASKKYFGGAANKNYYSRWDDKGRATFDINIANWPDILGDEMTRAMLKGWEMPDLQQWRLLVRAPTNVNDFRTQRRLRWGGFGLWSSVSEGATYQDFVAADRPAQKEATFALTKYGGLSGTISLEAMAADDMNQIARFPIALGISGANSLNQSVLDGIFTNGFSTNALTYASGATGTDYHFMATHTSGCNLRTAALSLTALNAARQDMLTQTKYDETALTLLIRPKTLWVPIELEHTAMLLTQARLAQPATASAYYAATDYLPDTGLPNIHQGMNYIVVGHWTDATDWYMSADPAMADFIEVAFWRGIQEPEIFTEAPNTGSNFTADVVTYKARLAWGWCLTDHRGVHGSHL